MRFRELLNKERDRAAEYRAQAAEMLRLAGRSSDERQRATLLNLAGVYHRLAEQFEDRDRLGDKPND